MDAFHVRWHSQTDDERTRARCNFRYNGNSNTNKKKKRLWNRNWFQRNRLKLLCNVGHTVGFEIIRLIDLHSHICVKVTVVTGCVALFFSSLLPRKSSTIDVFLVVVVVVFVVGISVADIVSELCISQSRPIVLRHQTRTNTELPTEALRPISSPSNLPHWFDCRPPSFARAYYDPSDTLGPDCRPTRNRP